MKILAKSSGISLEDHTRHVVEEAINILNAFPFLENEYQRLTQTDLRKQLLNAAQYHDLGKQFPQWQNACQKDYQNYQNWCIQNNEEESMDSFKKYDPYGKKGVNLRSAGVRHEFSSLLLAEQQGIELNDFEKIAIAAHHGKLGIKHRERWTGDAKGVFEKYWGFFQSLSYSNYLDTIFTNLKKRYQSAGIRALLQLADTRASRAEGNENLATFAPFKYDFPHNNEKRGVQKVVETYWNEQAMILRAPTGSGKTDAALLWAQHQIKEGRADRLVIAMPTRFTSNALSININDSVNHQIGLYHSSAWYSKFKKEGSNNISKSDARELHKLARLLCTPVTVSTIDHLLISLTGTREDHHAIFFNLMNACVVIDEADFYDDFIQGNLQTLLSILKYFEVPVLIMSATVPESAKELYQIPFITEDLEGIDDPKCEVKIHPEIEDLNQIEDLLNLALTQPTIIYTNTVDRAVAYYNWFQEKKKEEAYNNLEICLYHSRFTEPDKKLKEETLAQMLGKEAHKAKNAKGIAIMTQIGEMSINISAPLMISDICPFDRLAQRAGRLNRFAKHKEFAHLPQVVGELHVIVPYKNGALYPAPYGSFDKSSKEWQAGQPLLDTIENIEEKIYTASDFIDEVNKLYPSVKPKTPKIEENERHLEDHINNWLIIPLSVSEEDTFDTSTWSSRDIPQQVNIFVQIDDLGSESRDHYYFKNYSDFLDLQLESAISIPLYQLQKAVKHGFVLPRKYQIGEKEKDRTLYYSVPSIYTEDKGLIFDYEKENLNNFH